MRIDNKVNNQVNKDRPQSIKLDRFGRIAFDKNKQLSQASIKIEEEEKKGE